MMGTQYFRQRNMYEARHGADRSIYPNANERGGR